MSMKSKTLALLLGLIFLPMSAHALIAVHPGTYEIAALIVPTGDGPTAVFNLKSKSECRLLLTGNKAMQLKLESPQGLFIRIKLTQTRLGAHAKAELLEVQPLNGKEVPALVGNEFIPLAE